MNTTDDFDRAGKAVTGEDDIDQLIAAANAEIDAVPAPSVDVDDVLDEVFRRAALRSPRPTPAVSEDGAVTASGYIRPLAAVSAGTSVALELEQRPILSAREREVLLAWLRCETKVATARTLYLSASTINTHLVRIRDKYAAAGRPATSKAALLARALQDGLTRLDEW